VLRNEKLAAAVKQPRGCRGRRAGHGHFRGWLGYLEKRKNEMNKIKCDATMTIIFECKHFNFLDMCVVCAQLNMSETCRH
jgi:hypothetical protein